MSSGQQAGGGEGAAQGAGLARLSESEQKLVAKLLSDPTYFPIEFRTWLKQFIEGSGIIITASQIQGGTGTNVATGLPAGIILPVAASGAVPADCLACDGSEKVRADYPLLFGRIGTAWGAGDGSTTFRLPDLRDRALYGAGGWVGVAAMDAVPYGSRGGPNHHHDISQTTNAQGSHSHGGGTNSASHSHSMDNPGGHSHGSPSDAFALTTGLTTALGSGGSIRTLITSTNFNTANAGGHTHNISGGDHAHGINSDGSHTHVLSGPTGGGFALVPSYAGVIYVITIGTSV